MTMKRISFLMFLILCVCLSQLCMSYTKYPISKIREENNEVIIYTDNLREDNILFLIQNNAIQARFKMVFYNKAAHLAIVKLDSEYNIKELTNNDYLILENKKLKNSLSKTKRFFELGDMYFKSQKYKQALEAYTVAYNIQPVSIKELYSKVTLTNIMVDKAKTKKAFENKEYEMALYYQIACLGKGDVFLDQVQKKLVYQYQIQFYILFLFARFINHFCFSLCLFPGFCPRK